MLDDSGQAFGEAFDLCAAGVVHHGLDPSFILLEGALSLLDASVFLVGEEKTG